MRLLHKTLEHVVWASPAGEWACSLRSLPKIADIRLSQEIFGDFQSSLVVWAVALGEVKVTYALTHTFYTQAWRLCISVITPQGMPGNLVKDVRNVNHLQSVLLSHWSILPLPEEPHWSLVQPAVLWLSCAAVAQQDSLVTRLNASGSLTIKCVFHVSGEGRKCVS